MKKTILFLVAVLGITSLHSQTKCLSERIEGVNNFHQVMKIAKLYYDSIDLGYNKLCSEDMKRKHWNRYESYTKQHLLDDGTIANEVQLNLVEERKLERTEINSARSTNSNWSFVGPSNHIASPTSNYIIGKGRVDRIGFHPTDPNIIIVGTPDGGMFKTVTNGSFWYPVNNNLPVMGISGVAFSKTSPNIVYALTGCGDGGGIYYSAGVLKSMDSGETWELTASFSTVKFTGYNIVVDEFDPNIVLVATSVGLFRTKNGGNTWLLEELGIFYDVKIKPGEPNCIYAVGVITFFKFDDTGSTFLTIRNTFTMAAGRKVLEVTQANPNIVYILSGPAISPGVFRGIWKSSDSGNNFTLQSTTPNIFGAEPGVDSQHQSNYDICITASHIDPNLIIMGGLVSNKSLNGGVSWSNITTYSANSSSPNYVHPDVHSVKINPLNNSLFIATDGGIYRSLDMGATWLNITNNINSSQFYHFSVFKNNSNCIVAGAQDNGVKAKISNSTLMDHITGADGFQPAYNPIDSSEFYCSINNFLNRFRNNGLINEGVSPAAEWFMKVATHISDPNIVFAGGSRLYKSTDKGASWDTIFQPAGTSIAMCQSNPNRLFIAGWSSEFKMHRLDNLGATVTRLDNLPGFPPSKDISDIAVHPILDNYIYIAVQGYHTGEKVYRSINSGATWTNISSNLPDIPILSIGVSNNNEVYVGTDIGVFYLKNSINQWAPFRNGMPKVRVSDIMVDDLNNKVFACTFGRGIWSSAGANPVCDVDLVSTPVLMKGYYFYEASNSIQSQSIIQGGQGTKVFLKAGNYIDLKEGFHVYQENTEVQVYINSCGNGLPQSD